MWLASGQITSFFNLFTGGVLFLEDNWDAGRVLSDDVDRADQLDVRVAAAALRTARPSRPCRRPTCSSLFMLNVGAGPATPSRLRQAIARFGPVLRIVYGLSEVIVVTAQPGLTEDPEHPERLALRRYGVRRRRGGDPRRRREGARAGAGRRDLRDEPAPLRRVLGSPGPDRGDASSTAGCELATSAISTPTATCTSSTGCRTRSSPTRRNWTIYCRPIEDVLRSSSGGARGGGDRRTGSRRSGRCCTPSWSRRCASDCCGSCRLGLRDELNEMYAAAAIDFLAELPLTRSPRSTRSRLRKLYAELHPS